jgi:hypothetical protein
MNYQTQTIGDLSIEWFKQIQDKFIVKFDNINIPIEMNKTYFNTVLKDLQN